MMGTTASAGNLMSHINIKMFNLNLKLLKMWKSVAQMSQKISNFIKGPGQLNFKI